MNIRIEWTYQTPKGTEVDFHSESMSITYVLLFAEDLGKIGRTKKIVFLDEHDSTWTIKEMRNYIKALETDPHNVKVYFDGGFEHATLKSGLGCVIYYEQNGKKYRLRRNVSSAEFTSNNEAEYGALYLAVQELELLNVHHLPVLFIGDSQVVINQMKEDWPTLEKDLLNWANKIEVKLKYLNIQAEYELVLRKVNAEADRLATQALNGIQITATSELLMD